MDSSSRFEGLTGSMGLIPSIETARIVACLSWLMLHRALSNNGFFLRSRGLGTDGKAALVIGLTSTLWTASAIHTLLPAQVGLESPLYPYGKVIDALRVLASAPVITQVIFCSWLLSMLDILVARTLQRPPLLWQGSKPHGPFDWSAGLPPVLYWTMMTVISLAVAVPSLISIRYGPSALPGCLNLAGLSLFILTGTTHNPYITAPHRYTDDSLRIVLPTTHHEGTVYVLPGPGRGFDAVWSPKVAAEHADADEQIMTLFRHLRADRWGPAEPLERLRTTLAHYQARTRISTQQAERLAAWIYLGKDEDEKAPRKNPDGSGETTCLRRIECLRAPGVHLIGRDLMYALCHAEYLVFTAAGRLRPETAGKMGMLRLVRRSGASSGSDDPDLLRTRGFGWDDPVEGYKEAVRHVYAMFDQPVDQAATHFEEGARPSFSYALNKTPGSIEEYVGDLWELATKHCESTFSALYFFTTVWAFEVGNVNGFHLFPLRVRDRDGDVVSQLILWRQVWWAACLAQLVSCSPMLFGLFVVGFVPAA